MKEFEKIIEKLKELKPYLEKEYSVEEIGVFGSYVRDEQREDSDIDVLVSFDNNARVGLLKFSGMQIFLSGIFNRKIDLVSRRGIHPALKKFILGEVKYA
jgi:uncharacterized protein